MAYTKSNELQTRIALKYDSYENWTTNNPVLLAGELAIATIPAGTSVPTKSPREMQDLPNVVMKVGDGSSHYNDLKFVSALAADVYDWAKAATRPTYTANDIADLDKFVEDHSDYDTNTQYTIETVADTNGYKFELKYKDIGDESFKSFNTPVYMDLTGADTRLKKLEKDIADLLGGEGEGAVGGIQELINNSIANLDSEAEQTAGADGLALKVVMEDGALKSISGSIAANTYDAHGAAKAVQGETASTVKDAMDAAATAKNAADAAQKAADDEKAAREAAIQALDYNAYEAGTAEGTTISFVGTISETDGIISAEKRDLVFQSAYNAETNKAATMADVTGAVADLNGAMHFEGVSSTDPVNDKVTIEGKEDYAAAAGDVVIYNTIEYVYDGNKWIQLGDETMAGTLIASLDVTDIAVGEDSTLSVIGETDGLVHAIPVKIQIVESQVTGLEDHLEELRAALGEDGELPKQVEANRQAIATIQGKDTDKSMRDVAADEAANAVDALELADEAVAGQYVAAVKQTDGQIEVVRADLPVIPSLELVEGTATTPEASEIAVVADIDVDGHKITDTRVNVATMAGVAAAIAAGNGERDVSSADAEGNFYVVNGLVQKDGAVTLKEKKLAKIAESGNIADLKQTADTYVVFNCGSSSVNI